MIIDTLNAPDSLWYEDRNGNKVDVDISQGFPSDQRLKYQISKLLVVEESICNICEHQKSKWPVRFFEWILNKMPQRWREEKSGVIYRGHTTINSMFSIIQYLVFKRGWNLNDAAVLCADLCSRCSNILLNELNPNEGRASSDKDFRGTWCKYCKTIDPDYDKRHRIWWVYRCWWKLNRRINIKKSYEELW